jgi:lipopolysaccharide exporter
VTAMTLISRPRLRGRTRGEEPDEQQLSGSLSSHVRRGALWNVASTLLLKFSSIGITALVARILTPHDFGVFAVANTVFVIVSAFGEFGIASCIARADLKVGDLAPTMTTVAIGTSLAIAAVMNFFAAPIAAALGAPDGAGPVRIMALVMILSGIAAVPTAQCIREFKQGSIFLANVIAFFPGMIVLVVLAKTGGGPTAFAWSRVAGQLTSVIVIFMATPRFYRFGMSRKALSVLFKFGFPLAVANFVSYILQNVDYALIGHFMGAIELGTYVIAFNSASWSSALLLNVLTMVAMPAFSRVKHDSELLLAAMADGVRAVMLVAAPMCTLVIVLARPIVLTLYGARWEGAVNPLRILSLYGLISVLCVLFANMLTALGKTRVILVVQLIWLAALVPAMAIGVHEDGIVGAASAHIAIVAPVVLPCYLFALRRETRVKLISLAKAGTPPVIAASIAAAVTLLVMSILKNQQVELFVGGAAGGLVYCGLMLPQIVVVLGRGKIKNQRMLRLASNYYDFSRLPAARGGLTGAVIVSSRGGKTYLNDVKAADGEGAARNLPAPRPANRPRPLVQIAEKPSQAVRLLQVFAFTLIVIPGDFVIKSVGADGYPAALVAYLLFVLWFAGTMLGQHRSRAYRYPTRITLVLLWIVSLASYALINHGLLTGTQLTAANRWFMQLLVMSAVVIVAAEGLPTLEDVRRVLRALIWGGAVCGVVAALQFRWNLDLTSYLKLPGFTTNSAAAIDATVVARGAQNRVPGTGIDPIEMGVAMSMLLALAIYMMIYDTRRRKWLRVVPVILITVAVAASVSRSAVIAVVIACGGLVISFPPTRRLKGLATVPIALGVIALAAPGLIQTLVAFFAAAPTDPSITHRTNNYPYVLHLVRAAPWLGQGGGTYVPAFSANVLDNEYLSIVIELGLLGLAALIFYMLWPVVCAFVARNRTSNPELRDLCAALGAAELAAVATSATFDSFSFPMFYNLQALIVGLIGAVWLIVKKEANEVPRKIEGNG